MQDRSLELEYMYKKRTNEARFTEHVHLPSSFPHKHRALGRVRRVCVNDFKSLLSM